MLSAVEVCAGAGGQALGLEHAGISHHALVDNDTACCATLRLNRPAWSVIEADLNTFDGAAHRGVELLAGGLPCPPFSVAGKQLGHLDERNLFPAALRLVDEIRPQAIMIENVRGFLDPVFSEYRATLKLQLDRLGYVADWRLLHASAFGVPQLRPRIVIVAIAKNYSEAFDWPTVGRCSPLTVGAALHDLIGANLRVGAKNIHARKPPSFLTQIPSRANQANLADEAESETPFCARVT